MDFIFKTMRILRTSYYSSYFATMLFDWPGSRPTFIRGKVKHSPPDQGYGDWGTVQLSEPIPKARSDVAYVTAGGNAMYNLNDLHADNTPIDEVKKIGLKEIKSDYDTIFSNIIITCMI